MPSIYQVSLKIVELLVNIPFIDTSAYTGTNLNWLKYLYLLIFSGEKPEICQWCGKGFNAKKTLKNHERLHTGILILT